MHPLVIPARTFLVPLVRLAGNLRARHRFAAPRVLLAGPCTLAVEAMKAWAERNVSTGFLIACISTALVWTCSLVIAMLHLAALAARP